MPCWVENIINVYGPQDELNKLEEECFSFNKIMPMPIEILEDFGKMSNWCSDNWGTKWDIVNEEGKFDQAADCWDQNQWISNGHGSLTVHCFTATCEPIKIMKHLSKERNVEVELSYYSQGDAEAGIMIFSKGEITNKKMYSENTNKDVYLAFLESEGFETISFDEEHEDSEDENDDE
jgi:hypothetical protein